MKKYQDRHLRKINNAINIAYLTTAILWGVATCSFTLDRKELNNRKRDNTSIARKK